ncbi:processive 1,2-diacylglycerol beta-glucosyltransferase [Paenibacillus taihuensis]|uniref:Processive 1,2-diacylglycerol beta-glucosyltransferase n=1 Tax=Paenibacillus taihuensis TaxID=1156355 RepID=A0A3D9RUG7_9BACL|nr:glycosyltransferase [Paenibacillus taihuensis]REE81184.1 processive 1,2-diacylglycerol beta-glucosyltransferase [Paenibacillus taihuensis]
MERGPILILTGDYGSGHVQAAGALRNAIKAAHPELATMVVDYMVQAHPLMHPLSKYMYLNGVQSFPRAYGYLYSKTRGQNRLSSSLKFMHGFGLGKFLAMLERVKPSAIISTFPLAAGAASFMKVNGYCHVPIITVITDFTDHSYWLHPQTDLYIVGSQEVAHRLTKVGVDSSRIAVTGIPIRPEYSRSYDKQAIRAELGLRSDLPTLLVMGGGDGLMGQEVTESLCSWVQSHERPDLQMIIVCGHNEKLRQQLLKLREDSYVPLVVTGFTDRIPELMAASDILITKSGGLTSSEALASGLPMLIYKPLPGQEIDNANFLSHSGAALHLSSLDQLKRAVRVLLKNNSHLETMRRQALRVSKPYAAESAAHIAAALVYKTNKKTV